MGHEKIIYFNIPNASSLFYYINAYLFNLLYKKIQPQQARCPKNF